MRKKTYRNKTEIFEAEHFSLDAPEWPEGVRETEESLNELIRNPPRACRRFELIYNEKSTPIMIGEWIITDSEGRKFVCSDADLKIHYCSLFEDTRRVRLLIQDTMKDWFETYGPEEWLSSKELAVFTKDNYDDLENHLCEAVNNFIAAKLE